MSALDCARVRPRGLVSQYALPLNAEPVGSGSRAAARSRFLAVAFSFLLRTGAGSFGLGLARTPVSRSVAGTGGGVGGVPVSGLRSVAVIGIGLGGVPVSGLVAGVALLDAGVLPPLCSDSQPRMISSDGGDFGLRFGFVL